MEFTISIDDKNALFLMKLAYINNITEKELLENLVNNKLEEIKYINPNIENIVILDPGL